MEKVTMNYNHTSYVPLAETPSTTPLGSLALIGSVDNEDKNFPPDFLCPLCHHLLRNPVACKSCDTVFCKYCIDEWFRKSKKRNAADQGCPSTCPGPYVEKRCPPILYSLLSNLIVPCANNKTRGCPQQALLYDQLVAHEQSCQYQVKICAACKLSVALKDIGAHSAVCEPVDMTCRVCKLKMTRKQHAEHMPADCLGRRCETLESEVTRLKEHDTKSQIQIKELETKLSKMEDVIKALVPPKQPQAAPFNFGPAQKNRHLFRKTHTVDVPDRGSEFHHIVPPPRSNSRERVGLFGSLGASSQYR